MYHRTIYSKSSQWWIDPVISISSMNIEDGAFNNFTALVELRFYSNVLPASSLHAMLTDLNSSPLRSLDLSYCEFGRILTNHLFSTFHDNSLDTLNMSHTDIEIIESGAFSNLDHLEILKLTGTNIRIVESQTFAGLHNLIFLEMTDTKVEYFNVSDTFSQLQTLHVSLVNPTEDPAEDGIISRGGGIRYSHIYITGNDFPNLKHLTIAYSEYTLRSIKHIRAIDSLETFTCIYCELEMYDLPRLHTVNLVNCHNYSKKKTWFIGMTSLATIKIIQGDGLFENVELFSDVRSTLRNLTIVVGRCRTCSYINTGLFSNLTALEVLDLSNSSWVIPETILENKPKLNILRLAHTDLSVLPTALQNLNLKILDVRSSKIASFSKSNITYLSSKKVRTVYASGNPFDCSSCDIQPFLDWFNLSDNIGDDRAAYTCVINGTRIDTVALLDCDVGVNMVLLLSVPLSSLLLFVVLGYLAYQYRWNIRYLGYIMRLRYYERREEDMESDLDIEYDAYVSHGDDYYTFVKDHLVPTLEVPDDGVDAYKLAVSAREFMPNEPLVDSITEYINKSRKTLILLSNDYIDDNMNLFEYVLARSMVEDRKDVIVLLTMEPIAHRMRDMPKSLNELLKRDLAIKWTTNPQGQQLFWKQIRRALKTPSRIRSTQV